MRTVAYRPRFPHWEAAARPPLCPFWTRERTQKGEPMRKVLLTAASVAALAFAAPALAEDAGGGSGGGHPYIPVVSALHAPTDAANDDAQGLIDVAKGDVGKGAGEIRDGTGCLLMRVLFVPLTLGVSLFVDPGEISHDKYMREKCRGRENDAGKTLAKLGVPAGPKVIGNASARDLAGAAIDTAAVPAIGIPAGVFNGTAVGTSAGFAFGGGAAIGDVADAAVGSQGKKDAVPVADH